MYGFPLDLNLQPLVGQDLIQLRLGRYDVQFGFQKTSICVQGRVTLLRQGHEIATWSQSANWSSLSFQDLLNPVVTRASVINKDLLEIEFDNGLILHIHDGSRYEVAQIYNLDDHSFGGYII